MRRAQVGTSAFRVDSEVHWYSRGGREDTYRIETDTGVEIGVKHLRHKKYSGRFKWVFFVKFKTDVEFSSFIGRCSEAVDFSDPHRLACFADCWPYRPPFTVCGFK